MKFLEQNWTWLVMIAVPLWITAINVSRNILMAAVSIPANEFLVKSHDHFRAPRNTFFAHDTLARTEKNP